MTKEQFLAAGDELGKKAQVFDGLHGYFRSAASRLYQCCKLFGLFSNRLGDVLEIGPFYGYIPFILQPNAASYTVLEGDDPAVYPLLPLYEERSIICSCIDLFETFGPIHSAPHTLPFKDGSFDTILCWETMEHFNFNPVKFVRELYRVLKPGGRVCITVPNRASFQAMFSLVFGRAEEYNIKSYFQFEDYESSGKKAFYGFHWREYSPPELLALFSGVGFTVQKCSSCAVFQDHGPLSMMRRMGRTLSRIGTILFPRYGTNTYLIATK
jgi:SAM-dependent methyltransferase